MSAEAVEHPARDRASALLARDSRQSRADQLRETQPGERDRIFDDHFCRRMLLMNHAAASAFSRDSDKSLAVRARPIDFMIDQRLGRITYSEARASQPRRHFGLFLMPAGARPQSFIERPDLSQSRRAE